MNPGYQRGLFPEEPTETRKPVTEPAPEPARALAPGELAAIAVNRPMRCEYTYVVPEELRGRVQPGMRVAISFARRREIGVVVGLPEDSDVPRSRLKAISSVLDPEPVVDGELLALTRWMADEYACSWGEALAAVLPAALKRQGGRRRVVMIRAAPDVPAETLAELEAKQPKMHRLLRTLIEIGGPIARLDILKRLQLSDSPAQSLLRRALIIQERVDAQPDDLLAPLDPEARAAPPLALLPEQASALDTIQTRLEARERGTFLLYGVTGSGKTEVYLRVIARAIEQGRGAIVLVPEIALTPQTVGRFRARFDDVAVLHSRMTDSQRLDMWMRVKRGEARVVVGARSAVFAPVRDLGVIVVDEEHESSFKQSNVPRYHARDVAVRRARESGAICILGTATPALESLHHAQCGDYEMLRLRKRVHGGSMPPIEVVDMRQERSRGPGSNLFSRRLRQLLTATWERGEQTILFLNRRGFAPVLWCKACEEKVSCKQCSVSLTFHRRIQRAVCHSCCEEIEPPRVCPSCTAPGLRFLGAGSQRVEEAMAEVLPKARAVRMDSDTMLRREDYESTLEAFGRGEIDVLVGTQMIAKGLDFPRVTLVGIVAADSTLHLPDFRAAERTFQLLSQVSGRAGRADLPGRIVVQTESPDHYAIVQAARHDYDRFAALEYAPRRELDYPPFSRLIRVLFDDEDEPKVQEAAHRCQSLLAAKLSEHRVQILGPVVAPIGRLRGRYRHHLLLKAPPGTEGLSRARTLLAQFAAETNRPRVTIDVDPIGMM